jgi:hypothetical protein
MTSRLREANLIRASDGPLFGVVLVFRDFTERRAL